jgi:GxxExxY protein
MGKLIEEALTRSVIGGFFEVYNTLGFGFMEHPYVLALEHELIARGHQVSRNVGVTIYYKGLELAQQLLDMLVDGKLIVEVKSTFLLHPAHQRQLRSYLQGTRLQVGLLLHFGPEPKFIRVVNSAGRWGD